MSKHVIPASPPLIGLAFQYVPKAERHGDDLEFYTTEHLVIGWVTQCDVREGNEVAEPFGDPIIAGLRCNCDPSAVVLPDGRVFDLEGKLFETREAWEQKCLRYARQSEKSAG